MLWIASSHSCIIVRQKGLRLGFPNSLRVRSFVLQVIFVSAPFQELAVCPRVRGGFPSPCPENLVGSFCCLVYCDSEGFVILASCEHTEQDPWLVWITRDRYHADQPLKQQPSIGWAMIFSDLTRDQLWIGMLTSLNFQSYDESQQSLDPLQGLWCFNNVLPVVLWSED